MVRMSDEQFGQFCELLRLCEEKNIELSVRHRIAELVWLSGNMDLVLRDYLELVTSDRCPFVKGTPRKITLFSDAQGYGPIPTEEEEMEQRVVINDRGGVFITHYNAFHTVLKKERRQIPAEEAKKLLREIGLTFAVDYQDYFATDVGCWNLTIENDEGKTFSFKGSLVPFDRSPLCPLSDKMRNVLDDFMLYCFDGKAEEMYQFVSVEFEQGGREYCYLANDKSLCVGERVRVPVGDYGKESEAFIVDIEFCRADDAPYPFEDVKEIIGRAVPPMPEELHGTIYEMVKSVVDALDYMGLLDLGAPPDEYDYESRNIAELLKPGMTANEIAEIMAKEMSRSFAEPYVFGPFIAPAKLLEEALNKEESDEN